MNFPKLHGAFFVLGLVVVTCAYASPIDDTAPVPGLKLGSPQPRDDFYVKVNGGAEFFEPPKKDNGNFSEVVNPTGLTNGVNSLGSQSGDDVTGSVGATFGYVIDANPEESWLGKNLRVEVSGEYFQTQNAERSDLSVTPAGNFITVGRLDGNYTGTNHSTDIGTTKGGLPNPVAFETLSTQDQFYQVGTAVRSDYYCFQHRVVLSPRLGFEYSHLEQDFHTSASGNRGSVDQVEKVNTDYFGPKLALEAKVQLTRNVIYFLEGDLSPVFASSDYSGTQTGSDSFLGGSGTNTASDSHNTISFKAGAMTGLYYDFGPVKLKLGGGFDYWNYVATVKEAALPPGTNTFGGAPSPFTIQPSHLASSDMLNPSVNMTVIVPF